MCRKTTTSDDFVNKNACQRTRHVLHSPRLAHDLQRLLCCVEEAEGVAKLEVGPGLLRLASNQPALCEHSTQHTEQHSTACVGHYS